MRLTFLYAALPLAFGVMACAAGPQNPKQPLPSNAFPELIISGDDARNGNYDPSLEYDRNGIGWMSYSAVRAGKDGEVETRIARSDDQGQSWRYVTDVNTVSPASAKLPNGKTITGKWWHEVSSLVHDPDDPGKEWKLYWHEYLARMPHKSEKDRIFPFGWIAYRSAPSPAGPWSDSVALIGAGPFPLPPYKTEFKIGDIHPDLEKYIVLSEPGTLYHNGRIYLSLQAARDPKLGKNKHDIILISSGDHGRNWDYNGVVFSAEDAKREYGANWMTGSSLVKDKGRLFVLLCPESSKKGHEGTVVYEFEDIDRARLKPQAIKHIQHHLTVGGQSDYDAMNLNGGIVMPQFHMKNLPKAFRVFNTGERPLD